MVRYAIFSNEYSDSRYRNTLKQRIMLRKTIFEKIQSIDPSCALYKSIIRRLIELQNNIEFFHDTEIFYIIHVEFLALLQS